MNLSKIKVIVFDLDGTLYEDTHHFNYYAERLKEKLPKEKAKLFERDYQLALDESHTLKIGRVYDAIQDLILVQLDNIVEEAYDWEGNKLSEARTKELYPKPISMDLENMLNVGDLWWVPGSIARHYGLNSEQSYEAFLETRTYMMSSEFQMKKIDGFKEVLEDIKGVVKLVLLTNSPEPDSEAILKKLELENIFHKKIFMGKKPSLTLERFEDIKNDFNVDYDEILSIGDNWINEIRPVQSLGCLTMFIDPHQLGNKDSADLLVTSMSEIIPLLKDLSQH